MFDHLPRWGIALTRRYKTVPAASLRLISDGGVACFDLQVFFNTCGNPDCHYEAVVLSAGACQNLVQVW